MKFHPHRWLALASFLALTLCGQVAPGTPASTTHTAPQPASGGPLTNEEVVKLVKLDLGDEVVIAKIKQAPTVAFKLETDDLINLKTKGVSKPVIAAMLARAAAPKSSDSSATAQDAADSSGALEPEYLGTVQFLDSAKGRLMPLEQQQSEQRRRTNAWIGKVEDYYRLVGEKSTVRFKEGNKLEFVMLVESQKVDPQGIIHLFAWEPIDGYRRLTISTVKEGMLGGVKGRIEAGAIPVKLSKYGKSSFKITPADSLPPGEYSISGSNNKDRFCFGIDVGAPGSAAAAASLERIVPFRTEESLPLDIVLGKVQIRSIKVTGWPSPGALKKAESLPAEMSDLKVKLEYSNFGKKDWNCRYSVAILDDKGEEIGTGERQVNLGSGNEADTHSITVKMRTLDFPRAVQIRVRVKARPD